MNKPSYIGHRERIKNKFKTEGLKPFLDHEVLELLLTYSIPRKDTKKIAWELLRSFGSLSAVLEAGYYDLQNVKGLGPQSAMLINIVRELSIRYSYDKIKSRKSISNQEELYNYCVTHLQNKKQEFFEVLFLDIKTRLIAAEILAEGNIDRATISPRKFLELVLKHGAKYVICVHNHPSGDPTPSNEDILMTDKLKSALEVLSVKMVDHIIIGAGKIYSLETKTYIERPKLFL